MPPIRTVKVSYPTKLRIRPYGKPTKLTKERPVIKPVTKKPHIHLIFDMDDTLVPCNPTDLMYVNVQPAPELHDMITKLKGSRHLFTSGNGYHCDQTLKASQLDKTFHKVCHRDMVGCKPYIETFVNVMKLTKLDDDDEYYFFDDMLENIIIAKYLGWKAIWIPNKVYSPAFIDKHTKSADMVFRDIKSALEYYLK